MAIYDEAPEKLDDLSFMTFATASDFSLERG
jgi:hypothetical protein